MRARQLIASASFGPAALKVIGEAFDAAWAQIKDAYDTDPDAIDAVRFKLANVLLLIASEESRDAEALRTVALERIAARKP